MSDACGVECSRYGMFVMWDVWDAGCFECSGCGMFGMSDVWDV